MKILFSDFTLPHILKDSHFPAGGWSVQLSQLLAALANAGHRAGVLTWKGANAYVGPQDVCDLVETYDLDRGTPKIRFATYRAPAMFAGARRYGPDVIVQSTSGLETGLVSIIAGRLDVPFVHRIACDTDADDRYRTYLDPVARLAFRRGLRSASSIICQNGYQVEQIKRRYPNTTTPVVRNLIIIPPDAPRDRPRPERTYVAWLAAFRKQKNLPLLARIARTCSDIEFRVAGMISPGLDEESLQALKELERLRNVRMVGYVTRASVWEFLAGAVALLSTSDYEGFSNSFLEAFATGTPVVARRAIDPDGVIAQHDLGIVADSEDGLLAATRNVCAIPPDRFDGLGLRCRAYVEENHAPAKVAQRLLGVLESLPRKSPLETPAGGSNSTPPRAREAAGP